jgi:hypothetical protein
MGEMAYTGHPMAGGMEMPERIHTFSTPNLTPDPGTGHIYSWSEEQFVARFKAGRVFEDSPMPWESFGLMSDLEIKAVYRYLKSLEPARNDTGPPAIRKDLLVAE